MFLILQDVARALNWSSSFPNKTDGDPSVNFWKFDRDEYYAVSESIEGTVLIRYATL